MAGDAETGVTIMQMDEGLDTGDVAGRAHRHRRRSDGGRSARRAGAARRRSDGARDGGAERGTLTLTPQPAAGVTYAAKISKDETRIDWSKPWQAVHNHIRGLSPFPGAWFEIDGVRVKALRSTRGEGTGRAGRAGRSFDHRLRRGRRAAHAAAARRQAADAGG